MRTSLCVRAAVTAGIALGGYMASSTISFGIVGVSSVEAAQFFTRKRVNGQWITGRFPKGSVSARATRTRSAIRTRRGRPVVEVPASAALAALPAPDLRRDEPATAIMPMTTGTLAEKKAATQLPDVEAALVAAAVGPVAPIDEAGLPAEDRVNKLRRALEARAHELKSDDTAARRAAGAAPPAVVPAAVAAPAPPVDAAASASLATSSIAVSPSGTGAGKAAPLVPRSVSYDFESGIKTMVFENSVVREPFDRAAMRGLMTGPVAAR